MFNVNVKYTKIKLSMQLHNNRTTLLSLQAENMGDVVTTTEDMKYIRFYVN